MPIEITVPRLGWSSEEGVFAGWLKKDGDPVVSGEPLFALESDKVTMEVESLDRGTLHISPGGPESGAVVQVGQVLGYLLAPGEQMAAPPAKVLASPRARARAKALGIEISKIEPAPGAKRIVEADVLHVASVAAPKPVVAAPVPRARQIIANRLEESFRAPHFYVHAEVDASFLIRTRDDLVPHFERTHGVRLTYNDLLVKAIALALRENPGVNAQWRDGTITALGSIDIGLAVQAAETLLTPVIRDVGRLSLGEIAVARKSLVDRCTKGGITPADLEGGSVTLSNLGPFGVDRFQAILNPPQSAIIAVGRIAKRPFVDGDALVVRQTVAISVSVDHRVVDGVAAAKFLGAIVAGIESPARLLL